MFKWWDEPSSYNAFILSVVSLLVTFSAFIFGIVGFMSMGSSLILCYGFENLVDLISSAIVLWRFFMPVGSLDTEARNGILAAREQRASIGISFVIVILGFMVTIAAIEDYMRGTEKEEKDEWLLYYISFISMLVFGAMGLIKFRFSRQLNSESLYKDGICSMVGAILSASLFCNTIIILTSGGGAWWLDPTVALICGLGSLAYGLHGVYIAYVVEGLPIFSRKWWKLKRATSTSGGDVEAGTMPSQATAPTNSFGPSGPILVSDHHGDTLASKYGTDVTNDVVVKKPANEEPTTTFASVPPMNAFTPEKADAGEGRPKRSDEDDDSITEIELT